MAVDKNDIQELTEHFDVRYVTQKECEERKDDINKRFAEDDKRIALVDHRLRVIETVAKIIATAVISQLVLSVFSLFVR